MALVAVLIGGLTVLAIMHLYGAIEPRLSALWCQPWFGMGHSSFRWRIRIALSPKWYVLFAPWLIGLLNPVYLLFLGDAVQREFAGICLGTYVGISLLCYPFYLGKALRQFRERLGIRAAEKLVKICNTEFSEPILLQAAATPHLYLRMAAIHGLKELGTPGGTQALSNLCGDRNLRISTEACKAYATLLKVLKVRKVLSLRDLDNLIPEHTKEQNRLRLFENLDSDHSRSKIGTLTNAIQNIVYSQLVLRRAFPHVYCEKCHVFGELRGYLDWRWVRCPVCLDAVDLHGGITTVIGTIGAGSNWVVRDGILRLGLWSEARKAGMYAKVSALEIVHGMSIDYDWAVCAVVEMLRNKHPEFEKGIPVHLVGSPPLGKNTLLLLREMDQHFDLRGVFQKREFSSGKA
jgi:hypothetical protein